MLGTLSLPTLIFIFILSSIFVWIAGIYLSRSTNFIDLKLNIGGALGGLIFLAITTNLPEIAIVISAGLTKNVGIAVGNILGGIAIQTVVLVLLDGIGLRAKPALSYKADSLQLALEGTLVIIMLVLTLMGTQLPKSINYLHIAPIDLIMVLTWITGIWLINKARTQLPWREKHKSHHLNHLRQRKIKHYLVVFILAAITTFIAGVFLELSSAAIAAKIGWDSILFGSTILAAVTALPELSTGLAAIKMGDYALAVSDIFGGNAFLPALFFPLTLLSGDVALTSAKSTDIYLASLGALLTAIYIFGLVFRPKKTFLYLGIDSMIVLLAYILGIIGLFFITHS